MKPREKAANLFIFFLLTLAWILFECHLNNIPYTTIFDPLVLLIPVLLTLNIGLLGEMILYIKELKKDTPSMS